MKKVTLALAATLALALPQMGYAQKPAADHAAAQSKTSTTAMADGEVRRIDKDAKKLTIRHGPIESLSMPTMTMVFQVRDTALLDKVNTGDKIRFNAEKISGGYQVTEIETVK